MNPCSWLALLIQITCYTTPQDKHNCDGPWIGVGTETAAGHCHPGTNLPRHASGDISWTLPVRLHARGNYNIYLPTSENIVLEYLCLADKQADLELCCLPHMPYEDVACGRIRIK